MDIFRIGSVSTRILLLLAAALATPAASAASGVLGTVDGIVGGALGSAPVSDVTNGVTSAASDLIGPVAVDAPVLGHVAVLPGAQAGATASPSPQTVAPSATASREPTLAPSSPGEEGFWALSYAIGLASLCVSLLALVAASRRRRVRHVAPEPQTI